MAFKFVVLAAFLAVAHGSAIHSAGIVAETYSAPIAYAAPVATKTVIAEADAPAHYDFGYSVSDPYTGDHKSQVESRRGDAVQGSYSLVDSDGTRRTVDYAADAINGFNAVVRKEPLVKAVAAPVAHVETVAPVAPVVAAAPAVIAARTYAAPAHVATSYESKTVTHHSAPIVAETYAAAPAVYARTYAAPAAVVANTYAAPVVAKTYAAAPAVYARTYAAPAVVAKTYAAAPAVYADAPIYARYSAPYGYHYY